MDKLYLSPTSLVVLAFILLAVIGAAYFIFSKVAQKPSGKKIGKQGDKLSIGVCPVCGTVLERGESVITALYPGENDRLCYIYGCPHCYPVVEDDTYRTCPVCKKELTTDGHLIARYFVRSDATERIHILGCTTCRFSK